MTELVANIILAAGSQAQWQKGLRDGVPDVKQLVSIKGKPLIQRIQSQFKDSTVVTHEPKIEAVSKKVYNPPYRRWVIETLYYSTSLWKQRTIILLGDVYYTPKAAKMIHDCKDDLMFFINRSDILAISFNNNVYHQMTTAIQDVRKFAEANVIRGKLWHLYRYLNDVNLEEHRLKSYYTRITDGSRDFDKPQQYIKWCQG